MHISHRNRCPVIFCLCADAYCKFKLVILACRVCYNSNSCNMFSDKAKLSIPISYTQKKIKYLFLNREIYTKFTKLENIRAFCTNFCRNLFLIKSYFTSLFIYEDISANYWWNISGKSYLPANNSNNIKTRKFLCVRNSSNMIVQG